VRSVEMVLLFTALPIYRRSIAGRQPSPNNGISTPPCHTGRTATIAKLHDKARRAIAAGEGSFRQAAEYLAEARKQGATQRQSAKAIGRSPASVNTLLMWRKSGYKGGAFERSNKSRVFSRTKQARRPITAEEALAQKGTSRVRRRGLWQSPRYLTT
jgi:hypothetical protein